MLVVSKFSEWETKTSEIFPDVTRGYLLQWDLASWISGLDFT